MRNFLRKFKNYFSRILFYFSIFCFIMLVFTVAQTFIFFNYFEEQNLEDYTQDMMNTSVIIDNSFTNIVQAKNLLTTTTDFLSVFYSNQSIAQKEWYKIKNVISTFKTYKTSQNFVHSIFFINDASKRVISSFGTFEPEQYFSSLFNSSDYNMEFWSEFNSLSSNCIILPPTTTMNNGLSYSYSETLIPLVCTASSSDISYQKIIILLNQNEINSLLDATKPTKNSIIYMIGDSKSIYAKTSNSFTDDDSNYIINSFEFGNASTKTPVTIEGKKYFMIFSNASNVSITNFSYVALIPESDIQALSNDLKYRQFFLIFMCFIFVFSLSIFFSKRIYLPINKLSQMFNGAKDDSFAEDINEIDYIKNNINDIISNNQKLNDNISLTIPFMNEFFILNLLNNNAVNIENSTLINQFKTLFPHSSYIVAIAKLKFFTKFYNSFSSAEIKEIENEFSNIIKKNLPLEFPYFTVQSQQDTFIITINAPEEANESILNSLKEFITIFKEDYEMLDFSISVGSMYKDISNIYKSFSEAQSVASRMSNFNLQKFNVYNKEEIKNFPEITYSFSSNDENMVTNYIASKNYSLATQRIQSIITKNIENKINNNSLKQLYLQIYNIIYRTLASDNTDIKNIMKDDYIDIVDRISYASVTELSDYLLLLLKNLDKYNNKASNTDLSEIKLYIDQNFEKDIYLAELSEKYNIPEKNLSKLLKNLLGMPFKQYITNLKIDRSKELLLNSSKNIDEISQCVGFNSRNTFIRAFKIHEGITPTEFRNIDK